jgi:hypothetical protein
MAHAHVRRAKHGRPRHMPVQYASPYDPRSPADPQPAAQPRPLNLADPQPRGPLLPKLPEGYIRVQPKRKSRAARRGR